jgi:hypothetical protein
MNQKNDNNTDRIIIRDWMELPWDQRNILSKICYVVACVVCSVVGLFTLCLIVRMVFSALGAALSPLLSNMFGPSLTASIAPNLWWVALLTIFLLLQRWFRMLAFIVGGGVVATFVTSAVVDYQQVDINNTQAFLIGAGLCALVSVVCAFTQRPSLAQSLATLRKSKVQEPTD